jgi:hypothetical protein
MARVEDDGHLLTPLFRAACRASLDAALDAPALVAALEALPANVDPLWPALARHLARCATVADRELLDDLARHPEKREPPLQWGLRYFVRGDVVFFDGTEHTLDELCASAGLPLLPYLEDLPPELDLGDLDSDVPTS